MTYCCTSSSSSFTLTTIYKDAHVSFPDNVSRCKSNQNAGKKDRRTTKEISPRYFIEVWTKKTLFSAIDLTVFGILDLGSLSTNILKDLNLCLWRIAGSVFVRFVSFFGTFHVKSVIFPSIYANVNVIHSSCLFDYPFFMRRQHSNKRTLQPFIQMIRQNIHLEMNKV